MKIIVGDMWEELGRANVMLVTTNAEVNKAGKLVMGRGAAAEAANRFPNLPYVLGNTIKAMGVREYNVLLLDMRKIAALYQGMLMGAFQVKFHWAENADLHLIERSARVLGNIASAMPWSKFVMNFPGIGNGRLVEQDVLEVIDGLPDNVFIYKKVAS